MTLLFTLGPISQVTVILIVSKMVVAQFCAQRDICTAPKRSARCVWRPSHLSPCTAPALPLVSAPSFVTHVLLWDQGRGAPTVVVNLGKWEGASLFS